MTFTLRSAVGIRDSVEVALLQQSALVLTGLIVPDPPAWDQSGRRSNLAFASFNRPRC